MTSQVSAEAAMQEAIEQAERACQAAVETTPEAYRGFLTFIRQNKRVAGSWSRPVYASIRLPYMGVDGRVKMAQDHHREESASLVIQTQFETEPMSEQLVCKAVVTSGFLGTATGHARVFLNGSGVDATNPLENAETSAVGRALGFLGYGLYGTGMASAEEVLLAVAERDVQRSAARDTPSGDTTEAQPDECEAKPPSERQLTFLRDLLEQSGTAATEIESRLEQVITSQDASLLIGQLRTQAA